MNVKEEIFMMNKENMFGPTQINFQVKALME